MVVVVAFVVAIETRPMIITKGRCMYRIDCMDDDVTRTGNRPQELLFILLLSISTYKATSSNHIRLADKPKICGKGVSLPGKVGRLRKVREDFSGVRDLVEVPRYGMYVRNNAIVR